MSGCDYLENVKGISLCKVLTVVSNTNEFSELKRSIRDKEGVRATDDYFKKVELTCFAFSHQLVYPASGKSKFAKFAHCNPSSKALSSSEMSSYADYIGFEFKNLESYIKGERNLQDSNELREVEVTDFDKLLRFFCYIPRHEFGLLSNLTSETIRLDNFDEFEDIVDRSDNESFMRGLKRSREETIKRNQKLSVKRRETDGTVKSIGTATTKETRVKKCRKPSKRLKLTKTKTKRR